MPERFMHETGKKMHKVDMGRWHLRGIAIHFWLKFYQDSEVISYILNKAYFGHGCYGIDATSHAFFKKNLGALNIEEMAALIALTKNPNGYSLIDHPGRNKEWASKIMTKAGYKN